MTAPSFPHAVFATVLAKAPATAFEFYSDVFDSFAAMSAREWFEFGTAAALVVVGIKALVSFRASWRGDADPSAANAEMLVALREMSRTGEISEDEYRSVRSQVAGGQPTAADASTGAAPVEASRED